MRRAALAVVLLAVAGARPAFACPSCFGQADGPMADATRVGMWVLLGLTFALQGALAAFFMHLISEKKLIYWMLILAGACFIPLLLFPTFTMLGAVGPR